VERILRRILGLVDAPSVELTVRRYRGGGVEVHVRGAASAPAVIVAGFYRAGSLEADLRAAIPGRLVAEALDHLVELVAAVMEPSVERAKRAIVAAARAARLECRVSALTGNGKTVLVAGLVEKG